MLIQQMFQYTIYTQSYAVFEGKIVRAHLRGAAQALYWSERLICKGILGDVLNRNLFGAALHMTNQNGQMC
jgi:hypothetical protein